MTQRIEVLKNILVQLHNGASPETVQDLFNQHFTGVSAIEISLMEHELMSGDHGIGFEDVMKLCNVHANLFKNAVHEVAISDTEQLGHPVHTFKLENVALRAALMRINRLFQAIQQNDTVEEGLIKGLDRQLQLLGQFDRHYSRKEYVFFPVMEKYGHDAPPKVMWGVDDEIRDLYQEAYRQFKDYPNQSIETIISAFKKFEHEFTEMIFKEETILLMILIETFSQDDWLQIAEDSEQYGYTIITPEQKWQPERADFTQQKSHIIEEKQPVNKEGITASDTIEKVITTPSGTFTVTYQPHEQTTVDPQQLLPFGNGHLSIEQANLILNHLPIELTFVNKDDIFQYYNDHVPFEQMLFKRNPSQVGRNVELCHPPKLIERVRQVFDVLRTRQKDKVVMWFKRDDKMVHISYIGVFDEHDEFAGVLELVQDIQPYRNIQTDIWREIDLPEL